MTDVAYNSPQYGYGQGVPPQPVPPQPMPSEEPEPSVASYDVDPAPEHAPPAVVQQPTEPVSFEKTGWPAGAEAAAPVDTAPVETAPEQAAPEQAAPAEAAPVAAASQEAAPREAGEPVTPTSPSGRVAVQVVDRLRSTGERGTTTVPTPVIEKIAALAVREVPGVYGFAVGDTAGDGAERTLAIEVAGRAATVTLHLVIEYGFAVHSVTEKVRHKVISALENLFSLDITAVDIVIDDIHLEDAAEQVGE